MISFNNCLSVRLLRNSLYCKTACRHSPNEGAACLVARANLSFAKWKNWPRPMIGYASNSSCNRARSASLKMSNWICSWFPSKHHHLETADACRFDVASANVEERCITAHCAGFEHNRG